MCVCVCVIQRYITWLNLLTRKRNNDCQGSILEPFLNVFSRLRGGVCTVTVITIRRGLLSKSKILNVAVCISHSTNTHEKGMN